MRRMFGCIILVLFFCNCNRCPSKDYIGRYFWPAKDGRKLTYNLSNRWIHTVEIKRVEPLDGGVRLVVEDVTFIADPPKGGPNTLKRESFYVVSEKSNEVILENPAGKKSNPGIVMKGPVCIGTSWKYQIARYPTHIVEEEGEKLSTKQVRTITSTCRIENIGEQEVLGKKERCLTITCEGKEEIPETIRIYCHGIGLVESKKGPPSPEVIERLASFGE